MNTTGKKGDNYEEKEYIVSIIENYAREIGISVFNIRTMHIYISQFIDNEAYSNSMMLINYWHPIEILQNQKSRDSCLSKVIKKSFKTTCVNYLRK